MKQGLVSIGIPTYNSQDRLGPLFENFQKQTYRNLELIVSDDASRDNTFAVCQSYAAKDSRMRCIRQEKNLGQLGNFPFVLSQAKGEYFMWASDDDHWSHEFVEKLVSVLEAHPECGVAMSSYARVFTDRSQKVFLMEGPYDLSGKSYFYSFRQMVLDAPIHAISYGIFRRDFLTALMQRPRPGCMRWERVLMAEVTLVTHISTIPEVLFFKHENPIPMATRYQDVLSHAYGKPFALLRYAVALLFRQITSPMIPLYRKVYVVIPWIELMVWRRRSYFEDLVRGIKIIIDLLRNNFRSEILEFRDKIVEQILRPTCKVSQEILRRFWPKL
ncbi:MAG: glycosyltransferase family 2 protein [bacterium]|nr:glycosyltransferase family 2 protein [bacterium]